MALNNLGSVVGSAVFRGAQPASEGDWETLMDMDVRGVLKLNTQEDYPLENEAKLAGSYFQIVQISLNGWNPDKFKTLLAARHVKDWVANRDGALYVHCTHGRDRTGLVIAAYRILYEGWPLDLANAERARYGIAGLAAIADVAMGRLLVDIYKNKDTLPGVLETTTACVTPSGRVLPSVLTDEYLRGLKGLGDREASIPKVADGGE